MTNQRFQTEADSLWIGESASLFPPWGVFAHPQRIEISLSMSLSTRKMLQVAPTDLLYRTFFALLLFYYHSEAFLQSPRLDLDTTPDTAREKTVLPREHPVRSR